MATSSLFSSRFLIVVFLALALAMSAVWALGGTSVQGAATLNVTSTADGGAGSLRQAILDAASGDTVSVPAGTYTLTQGTDLLIDKSLTITGAGKDTTIIQAAASAAVATSRVFNITSENNDVVISDVTIRQGKASGSGLAGYGGGIYSSGFQNTLTLTNSTISGNSANYGGGIHNGQGSLTMTNSTVSDNSANYGGGISKSTNGTLTVTNSTISGNQANYGAGINKGGSTATLTLTNSTISGNTAEYGGGIYNVSGTATLTNSTISGNQAEYYAGIRNDGTGNFKNSILSGNTASNSGHDCSGTWTSQGHNLVQNTSGCTIAGDLTGNITGQDPLLSPLRDNGGPTHTHAPHFTSPAIDAGDNSVLGAPHNLTTDQRGAGFPRLQRTRVDIGAYEVPPPDSPHPRPSPRPPTRTTASAAVGCQRFWTVLGPRDWGEEAPGLRVSLTS